MRVCRPILLAAMAGGALAASPALAQGDLSIEPENMAGADYAYDAAPGDYAAPPPRALPPQPGERPFAYGEEERQSWLAECRRRYGDNGLGGALIGGVLGGVAGNRIAGRGNRTVGTIAGAAVGAVAGAAIDKSEDAGRVRDDCEEYLARYEAGDGPGPGYGAPYGYGYGYAPVMWVPVMQPGCACNCKPKVREVVEWVDEKPARRVIPKRTKLQPVKPAPRKTKLLPVK